MLKLVNEIDCSKIGFFCPLWVALSYVSSAESLDENETLRYDKLGNRPTTFYNAAPPFSKY